MNENCRILYESSENFKYVKSEEINKEGRSREQLSVDI